MAREQALVQKRLILGQEEVRDGNAGSFDCAAAALRATATSLRVTMLWRLTTLDSF